MRPFADRLLAWWDRHGRHDLPWQQSRTPYRIWVAEIMLQQTQVGTVTGYYQRFLDAFPDLPALAGAAQDQILALWSGLGYYARARNLHRAAGICMEQHGGRLPVDLETLQALPGIGRSTAAAILAQAHNQRHAILDGNVKRLLARHAGIAGWPGQSAIAKALWHESEIRLPEHRSGGRYAPYTQAVMDLGATVCTRARPDCEGCPVSADCQAYQTGRVNELPTPRPRRKLPERETTLLILTDARQRILFVRRPPAGVWGGLWCFPEAAELPGATKNGRLLSTMSHTFTHFRLQIEFRAARAAKSMVGDDLGRWMTRHQALTMGLPQPVRNFLES